MSEGGRDPIIIPIGFIIDESSLDAAIRVAKERFATALGNPYEGITPDYARPYEQPAQKQEQSYADQYEEIFGSGVSDREIRMYELEARRNETFDAIEKKTEELSTSLALVLVETTTATERRKEEPVKKEEPEIVQHILDWEERISNIDTQEQSEMLIQDNTQQEILDVAEESVFSEAQQRAANEYMWEYFRKWITNVRGHGVGGFAENMPAPFERVTAEGAVKEKFKDVALLAERKDAGEFFEAITSRLDDDELQRDINEKLMEDIMAITGGITEEGALGFQVMMRAGEMTPEEMDPIYKVTDLLQRELTKGLLSSPELFTDLATMLQDRLTDAFTNKGVEMLDNMITAAARVTPVFVSEKGKDDIKYGATDLLTMTDELETRIEDKFEKWRPEKKFESPGALPEFATLAEVFEMARYRKQEREFASKYRNIAETRGSRTLINEGAMQVSQSLPAPKGVLSGRHWITPEERDKQLFVDAVIEDMVTSREGLEEVKAMFGPEFATQRSQSLFQYETDASRLFHELRRRAITVVAEHGEPDLLQRQEEQVRSPEDEIVRPGALTMPEFPELNPKYKYPWWPRGDLPINIGQLFEDKEETRRMNVDQIGEFMKRKNLKDKQDADIVRTVFGGDLVEKEPELEEWEKILTSGRIFLPPFEKEKEDPMAEPKLRMNIMVSKLEKLIYGEEEGRLNTPKDQRTAGPTAVLSDETIDEIAESVTNRMSILWQQTIGGSFTPHNEFKPIRRKGNPKSTTGIGKLVDHIIDETSTDLVNTDG